MKRTGFIREMSEEYDSDTDFRISACVATKEKIAMDWYEDGDNFHATLYSDDGIIYRGSFGTPLLDENLRMEAIRQEFNGSIILLVTWTNMDTGSCGLFHAFLEIASQQSEAAYALSDRMPADPEKASAAAHLAAHKAHALAAKEGGNDAAHHRQMSKWHKEWADYNNDPN